MNPLNNFNLIPRVAGAFIPDRNDASMEELVSAYASVIKMGNLCKRLARNEGLRDQAYALESRMLARLERSITDGVNSDGHLIPQDHQIVVVIKAIIQSHMSFNEKRKAILDLRVANTPLWPGPAFSVLGRDNAHSLVLLGANPNAWGHMHTLALYGQFTPLFAVGDDMRLAATLLRKGADPNVKDSDKDKYGRGLTPLRKLHNLDIRLMLIRSGRADVNTVSNTGNTPLLGVREMMGYIYTRADVLHYAEVLINHGANVNAVAKDGGTPLDEAWNWPELHALLVNAGARPGNKFRKFIGKIVY